MNGSWLSPIEIQGSLPRRILVVSDNREDYYWTVQLLLDRGWNMEILFKKYDQIPRQGVFDILIFFSPPAAVLPEAYRPLVTQRQNNGYLVVVDDKARGAPPDKGVKVIARDSFPALVGRILDGKGLSP